MKISNYSRHYEGISLRNFKKSDQTWLVTDGSGFPLFKPISAQGQASRRRLLNNDIKHRLLGKSMQQKMTLQAYLRICKIDILQNSLISLKSPSVTNCV